MRSGKSLSAREFREKFILKKYAYVVPEDPLTIRSDEGSDHGGLLFSPEELKFANVTVPALACATATEPPAQNVVPNNTVTGNLKRRADHGASPAKSDRVTRGMMASRGRSMASSLCGMKPERGGILNALTPRWTER